MIINGANITDSILYMDLRINTELYDRKGRLNHILPWNLETVIGHVINFKINIVLTYARPGLRRNINYLRI